MTEINKNNMHANMLKYNTYTDKVEAKQCPQQDKTELIEQEEKNEPQTIKDTGVLGRSQVKNAKSSDVVSETVALMKNDEKLVSAANKFFDKVFDDYIKLGYGETEAYTNALIAQEEFFEIAQSVKNH